MSGAGGWRCWAVGGAEASDEMLRIFFSASDCSCRAASMADGGALVSVLVELAPSRPVNQVKSIKNHSVN